MFRYPKTKFHPIKTVEQFCSDCDAWFALPKDAVKLLQEDWKLSFSGQGMPLRTCKCPHCGSSQGVILPGKYDKPGLPKSECAVQRVVLLHS